MSYSKKEKLIRELNGLKFNEPLNQHTTFRIGGPAKFFYPAASAEDVKRAALSAKYLKMKYFILGGGSNLLVSDKGFDGLVIKIQDSRHQIKHSIFKASAGVSLSELVNASVDAGLSGLEWAAGIPGTLGGAIRGNAGAFNGSMSDVVSKVFIWRNHREISMTDYQERSGYRKSPFQETKDIILEAELRLKRGDKKESRKIISGFLEKRLSGQPTSFPSAGCVFKNVRLTAKNLQRLSRQYPEIGQFAAKKTVPAGWLIEKCGLKGKKIGGAMISEKHANFIINVGNAKARDVVALMKMAKKEAKKKFDVYMKEEIRYVGFNVDN